jgi:type IV pilus assembly protein PilN
MARINLLPWRAERRKQRQQEFLTMLGAAGAAGVLISFLIVMFYNGQIDGQKERNTYLTNQIAIVDKQIKEIEELDKKKDGLLRRKEVIENLQASRSQNVHLFDELVRTIPDGVRLASLNQNGDQLSLEGFAQSNARVSTYMRNLQASGWMTKPELKIIQAKGTDKGLPYQFDLTVTLQNPSDKANAEAGATGSAESAPAPEAAVTPAPATESAVPAQTPSTATPPAAPAAAPASDAKTTTPPPAAAATTGGAP